VDKGGQGSGLAEVDAAQRLPALATYRWVVERTFAWISHNRRMAKHYERLCATGEAFVYVAMTRLMVRRLARA
jgi:transposase